MLGIADTREFFISPKIGVQESFTDNVLLTPTNQQNDFITRFAAGKHAGREYRPHADLDPGQFLL